MGFLTPDLPGTVHVSALGRLLSLAGLMPGRDLSVVSGGHAVNGVPLTAPGQSLADASSESCHGG